MIEVVRRVLFSEGAFSVLERAGERLGEALDSRARLLRGRFVNAPRQTIPILNVIASSPSPRLGGVQTQLTARLDVERTQRDVALLHPSRLELRGRVSCVWPWHPFVATAELFDSSFEETVRRAIERVGASAIHVEGTAGIPPGSLLRLIGERIRVIVSVHDFSLFCARPHLVEQPQGLFCNYSTDRDRCHRCLNETWPVPPNEQHDRRALGRQLLEGADAIVFPSAFLRDRHRELFGLPELASHIIEPGIAEVPIAARRHSTDAVRRIAYAGSAKQHKGAHLLPEIVGALAGSDVEWHLFGGGDEHLLRLARELPRVVIHGYYRGGALPSLLRRHNIDLAILPSIVPESFGLTLSECWRAGVPVIAFDHGALAERITTHGGGWLAPLKDDAAGIASLVRRRLAGELTTTIPTHVQTASEAANAYAALYQSMIQRVVTSV